MSKCDDKQDEFLKNEYILNLDELIMTRNYVYKEKTYQKYRLTDLSTKKSNTSKFWRDYTNNFYSREFRTVGGYTCLRIRGLRVT